MTNNMQSPPSLPPRQESVHSQLHPPLITVYSGPGCMRCRATQRRLTQMGVAHAVVDLGEYPDRAADLRRRGYSELPVVSVLGGGVSQRWWSGHREELLADLADDIAARDVGYVRIDDDDDLEEEAA